MNGLLFFKKIRKYKDSEKRVKHTVRQAGNLLRDSESVQYMKSKRWSKRKGYFSDVEDDILRPFSTNSHYTKIFNLDCFSFVRFFHLLSSSSSLCILNPDALAICLIITLYLCLSICLSVCLTGILAFCRFSCACKYIHHYISFACTRKHIHTQPETEEKI